MNYGIIAAGEGSRLASEGVALPKPLVSLQGQPMIGRMIRMMEANGAENIFIAVNEHSPEVAEYLETLKPQLSCNLEVVVKTTPSSMHTFAVLSDKLRGKGKFVVTTVDTIIRDNDFAAYVRAFDEADDIDGLMAVTGFVEDEKPLYVETAPDMEILNFRDAPWDGARYVSGGIYGLTEPAIDVLDDCLQQGVSRMRNYQRALVGAGLRLRAFAVDKIMDVDHASDIEGAERFLGECVKDKR